MRWAQLATGWMALCALTAGGTYYGLIELDQQMGLQARLGSSGTGSVVPAPVPPEPVPKKDDPPVRVDPQPTPPDPAPKKNDPPPARVDRPPSKQDPPPARTDPPPVRTDPPPVRTPPNLGPVQARFSALNEQARDLVAFYSQREQELRAQGLPFRSDLRSAISGMIQNLNAAAAALRAGDAAQATRALDTAEQRIQYLEQAK